MQDAPILTLNPCAKRKFIRVKPDKMVYLLVFPNLFSRVSMLLCYLPRFSTHS